MPARDTDVAADALANFVLAPFIDFSRKVWVGDGRPGSANEIQDAALHLRHHDIGRRESTHTDDRFPGQLFDEIHDGLVTALARKARRRAIGRAGIHFDVPKIGDLAKKLNHFMRLGRRVDARLAPQLFHTHAQSYAAPAAAGVARHREHFTHQAYP